jgi:hypothetical protein
VHPCLDWECFALHHKFPIFARALAAQPGQNWSERAQTMPTPQQEQLSLIERIERALVLLAYFIELDDDVHIPMYEKFEAELKELRKKENTKDRARSSPTPPERSCRSVRRRFAMPLDGSPAPSDLPVEDKDFFP